MLFISKTLPYYICACVRNTPKIVTFVIGKMKLVSLFLFLDAFPPRPKMPFTYVVNVYSDISLSKGHNHCSVDLLGPRTTCNFINDDQRQSSRLFLTKNCVPLTVCNLFKIYHQHKTFSKQHLSSATMHFKYVLEF